MKSLRSMSYPDTDIFVICYNMTRRNTPDNIVAHDLDDMASYKLPDADDVCIYDDESWMAELIQCCGRDFKIILVGTKADYWNELSQRGTDEQKEQLS